MRRHDFKRVLLDPCHQAAQRLVTTAKFFCHVVLRTSCKHKIVSPSMTRVPHAVLIHAYLR